MLAKDSTGNAALESELAAAYERAGELMGSTFDSNLEGSRAVMPILEKALSLRRRVASAKPQDRDAVHDLAMSYYRYGNGQVSAGLLKEAISSLRQGIDVAGSIGDDLLTRSARATLQARLCALYNVTAGAAETLALCREAIRELSEVAARKPRDEDIAHSLALTHAQFGNALRVQGKIQEALPVLRNSAARFRELIQLNPNSTRSRNGLASVQVRLTTAWPVLKTSRRSPHGRMQ